MKYKKKGDHVVSILSRFHGVSWRSIIPSFKLWSFWNSLRRPNSNLWRSNSKSYIFPSGFLKAAFIFRNLRKKALMFRNFSFYPMSTCHPFFSFQKVKDSLFGIWNRMFINALVTLFVHFHFCQFYLIRLPSLSQNPRCSLSSCNSWITIFFPFLLST